MPGSTSRRNFLAAALALPVAGCTPKPTTSRRTTITFWSALRGSKQVVQAFNKSQNRIQVAFEQIPSGTQGGYAKLSNAARAGNAPDVVTLEYPQLPGFAIDGLTSDLTELLSDELRARVLPQALHRTTFDGRVHAIPLDLEPMVLHYRSDVFEQHGFTAPRTWEEFADLARRIRDRLPDSRIAVLATDGGAQLASHACQAGAQWFDIRDGRWTVSMADEPTRRISDFWQRLVDEDLVFANPVSTLQYDSQVGNGLVLTRQTGAWDAGAQLKKQPAQKGKWAIAPIPQWDPARPSVGDHGGSTFAISSDSEHAEAAMEFIEWQVSHPDSLRARLSAGTAVQYPTVPDLVPVGRAALDSAYYRGQDVYALFAQEAAEVRDDWVWGPRMTATFQVLQDNLAKVPARRGTVFDAVRAAQAGTIPDLRALGLAIRER